MNLFLGNPTSGDPEKFYIEPFHTLIAGRPPKWTAGRVHKQFELRDWGSDIDTIAKSLRELAGLGILTISQAGARVDYSLNKERVEYHSSKVRLEA